MWNQEGLRGKEYRLHDGWETLENRNEASQKGNGIILAIALDVGGEK